jgi:hypothetical protein
LLPALQAIAGSIFIPASIEPAMAESTPGNADVLKIRPFLTASYLFP